MALPLLAAEVATLLALLAVCYRPLGDHMARTFTSDRDLAIERGLYRLLGVDPRAEQSWRNHLRSVLAFSVAGVLLLYVVQRAQAVLPYSLGLPPVPPGLSFTTAISFVTNTDWQSYSPETTVGYTVQLAGLAVQDFASAAVGLAVAVALVRGLAARRSSTIGNFWVDLVRGVLRILLPLSVVAAVVLLAGGVIQNFSGFPTVHTLTGGTATIPGGPVASQEAIKELGTNGGGFFNANSAHPFENPSGWTNLFEVFLLLVIPFSLPRTFGTMVGDRRQGRAVLGAMAALYVASLTAMVLVEHAGGGAAATAAGAAMEGKETRFGVLSSALFATSTTLTSTGAVDSSHDSLTPLGGFMALVDMMLGELAPGGVGSGLYGLLVVAVIAVFLAGLMIGRTPSYLGKQVGGREITLATLFVLTTPVLVLAGLGLSFGIPALTHSLTGTSILNPGEHGFTEVLYAFTSAGNNNGSAFGGLRADTPWLNASLGAVMFLGRFVPIVFVLALAGAFAAQGARSPAEGSLPTHTPLFVVVVVGTVVLVSALTYFPVLALGPLAEGLRA